MRVTLLILGQLWKNNFTFALVTIPPIIEDFSKHNFTNIVLRLNVFLFLEYLVPFVCTLFMRYMSYNEIYVLAFLPKENCMCVYSEFFYNNILSR